MPGYWYCKSMTHLLKLQKKTILLRNMLLRQQCLLYTAFPYQQRSYHVFSKQDEKILQPFNNNLKIYVSSLRDCHNNSRNDSLASMSHLFMPASVEMKDEEINVGEELVGPLSKPDVLRILSQFYLDPKVKEAVQEYGIDDVLFQQIYVSFRKYCTDSKSIETELHIIFSDIIKGAGHVHDIFPSFLQHSKKVFPHLQCMDDLCKISDLSNPPNWYPDARSMNRKIVFHAGPTNSGKTYHAMQQFLQADSGVYCGPLKLLAAEVFNKSNAKGTSCDLVTGEERRFGCSDSSPSAHVACTIEMASVTQKYSVAIIDEVQMLRDPVRGWAWTRALLGLCAGEVHVCGEEAAIPLVQELAMIMGEEVEVCRYKRLTPLTVDQTALESLENVQPGDCIVCFNKKDIHYVSRRVESLGHQVAVIYGGLPPGTKLAQAQKFNDVNHPCKIMVATDAIGMGLNLSIRRIVFHSVVKLTMDENGERVSDTISVSQALQIAGRAGRYGTQWEHGYVTTMKSEDMPILRRLLSSQPPKVDRAGLHPTAEQIELFAYHIPNHTLSNLVDIFVNVCTVDKALYFMCGMEDFKFLAEFIQHVQLPLRARYVFCCAPINKRMPFVLTMFLKFTRQFSQSEAATLRWLCHEVKWPFQQPRTIIDLVHLEQVFDVFDLYLWLSYRFPDMFPEGDSVHAVQAELDQLIEDSVSRLTILLKNSDPRVAAQLIDSEESATTLSRKTKNKLDSIMVQLDKDRPPRGKHTGPPRAGRGRLTEHLLSQGLLSDEMLAQLQKEWMTGERRQQVTDEPAIKNMKSPTKRRGGKRR